MRAPLRAQPLSLAIACLLALGCSSGGDGGTGGNGGGQGQAGTSGSAGASGGSSTAGAGGTQGSAGQGGDAGGTAGSSAGASAGGSGGAGGSPGTAGQAGNGSAGRGGATAGAGGSAGVAGTGGASGGATAGRGGTGGGAGASGGRGGTGGSAAGTGGGTGGGAANPVTPTKNGNKYRFAWGDVVFEIDAMVGARVGVLSLGGTNLIMTSATDPTTWGSVFWTSPRSAWTPMTWPPPPMIDNAMYTGTINGTHAVFTGPADTSIGVSMAKDYSADATSGWMKLAYTINATKAQKAAPWEVSRVPRGGIVFFPAPSTSAVVKGPLTITQSSGIVWFDDAAMTATSPNGDKLYADGMGWTAYLLNGNLFLKRFTDQPASAQPAMEGEIDVYPGAGFLEFEVQGPYTQIAANGNLPWSIEWRVVKVPSGVSVAVGSSALVDFARQQVAIP